MSAATESAIAPLVSVVIPLYNRQDSIVRAVQSALAQDESDLEIVVVDDGSTDDSVATLLAAIRDKRLRIVSQPNQGACVARNLGIEVARGKYIALLDSDDAFLPAHLSESITLLESQPMPTAVYGRIVVDRGGERTFLKPPRGITAGEDMSEYLLCDQGFVQTSTLVLPRQLALETPYDPALKFGQDTDFAIRLAHAGAVFLMLNEPQAIWADQSAPDRVSNALDPAPRILWLDRMGERVTARARKGDKGWYVAKALFKRGVRVKALLLYLSAVLSGCYRPKLAARIALQIFLPPAMYRRLADATLRPGADAPGGGA